MSAHLPPKVHQPADLAFPQSVGSGRDPLLYDPEALALSPELRERNLGHDRGLFEPQNPVAFCAHGATLPLGSRVALRFNAILFDSSNAVKGGISIQRKKAGRTPKGAFPGFSARLCRAVEGKGWSWSELARQIDRSPSSVHGLKEGDPSADSLTIYRISQVFGCSMEALLIGPEPTVESAPIPDSPERGIELNPSEISLIEDWRSLSSENQKELLVILDSLLDAQELLLRKRRDRGERGRGTLERNRSGGGEEPTQKGPTNR